MSREHSVFRAPWDGRGMERLRPTLDEEEIVARGLASDYPETFRRLAPR